MEKTTVSKEIYRMLVEHSGFVPSGEIETWHPLNATGSTVTRKLRLLESQKFIEVKCVDGHAHYRALRTKVERDAYSPENNPEELEAEIERPNVRYEAILKDGKPTGFVRPVPVTE
jgi:hypothetical protein